MPYTIYYIPYATYHVLYTLYYTYAGVSKWPYAVSCLVWGGVRPVSKSSCFIFPSRPWGFGLLQEYLS